MELIMKIFIFLGLIVTHLFSQGLDTQLPQKYKDDIRLFAPKQNLVTTKEKILFKGRIKSYFNVFINGKDINVNEAGRFFYKVSLNQLGHQKITIEFKDQHTNFSVVSNVIKLKDPESFVVSQTGLGLINTEYVSNVVKDVSLSYRLKRKELAYFLNKINSVDVVKKPTIKDVNSISGSYRLAVVNSVNSGLLSLNSNGQFNQNNPVTLLSFLVSVSRALKYEQSEQVYSSISKYKGKWLYNYLMIGLDKKIITAKDIPNLHKNLTHATFVNFAAKIPELKTYISAQLTFPKAKNKLLDKVAKSSRLGKSKSKKITASRVHERQNKNVKIDIQSISKISNSRKIIKGRIVPPQAFVVNWKSIKTDAKGAFSIIIPNDQNEVVFTLRQGVVVKDVAAVKSESKSVNVGKLVKKMVPIAPKKVDVLEPIILPYQDLSPNHWIARKANILKSQGKLENTKNFYPSAFVTRVDLARYLVRINGLSSKQGAGRTSKFSDLRRGVTNQDAQYINTVVANKLMNGMSNTNFGPKQSVTKLQAIIAAVRLLPEVESSKFKQLPYKDIAAFKWAYKDLQKAYHYKIISKAKTLNPRKSITKAELVSLLYKTSDVL
jgi:hypothetical protein